MKDFTAKTILSLFIMTLLAQNCFAADVTVIVNVKNPISSVTIDKLNAFFIKKERTWKDGKAVRFFDHRDENINRKLFLKKFINKTSREIELYWIAEKIYTGNIAPIQVSSDSMMTSMVSRFSGGIGYVSSKFPIPQSVKRIAVIKSSGKE